MIDQIHIGTFFLLINLEGQWVRFLVDHFQLSKEVGQICSLTVDITDSTDVSQAEQNTSKGTGADVGDMRTLLEGVFADVSQLKECRMVQYRPIQNGYKQRQWFTGRLCNISPRMDTSVGTQIGMTCFCLSKICQLCYRPFIDFVYTPVQFASNIQFLQEANVFYPEKIKTAMYAAADKLSTAGLLRRGQIYKQDTITSMLSKAATAIQNWLKQRGKAQEILAKMPVINLKDYIQGDLKLAQIVLEKQSKLIHPYVESLVQDFMGEMQNTTLFAALLSTLKQNGRQLTIVPPSRQDIEDKATIIPCAISKLQPDDIIQPQHIISFALGTNPLERVRQPDKIFVKAAYAGGWGTQDATGMSGSSQISSIVGQYALPGQKETNKIKLLYAPKWLFDILLRAVFDDSQIKEQVHQDLYQDEENKDNEQKIKRPDIEKAKETMDIFAKNMFFSTYRLSSFVNMKLAISEYTLDLDKKLGKSIKINIPSSAYTLVTGQYSGFYGKLQSLTYTYQAAKTVQSASNLSLMCSVIGLTPEKSEGSTIFKEGNDILYVNEGSSNG